jgi:hypothetical protein
METWTEDKENRQHRYCNTKSSDVHGNQGMSHYIFLSPDYPGHVLLPCFLLVRSASLVPISEG